MHVSALADANPVPVTVTFVPLIPAVGANLIVGVMVIACWTERPVFPSVRVNRYVPANRPVGTMNQVVVVKAFSPLTGTVVGPKLAVSRFVLLNVAAVIADKPVAVIVTLLPDTAVVGTVIDGVPNTVTDASAVSVGLAAVKRSVYSPGCTLAGNV